jgi:L-threonylcarbamoyladenylate synthase
MTASDQAETFERCMSVGGVAVFPADTVYGLACDPSNRIAVERLYEFKRRPLDKPSAVMFFALDVALEALPELGERTRAAMRRLLPGGVSLLLPNPAERFPLACGADASTLGVRVVSIPVLEGVRWPVLQSSANLSGGPDPRRLEDVPEVLRRRADMVVDGGDLPGTSSTVVDLTGYEQGGAEAVSIIRRGAVSDEAIAAAVQGDA